MIRKTHSHFSVTSMSCPWANATLQYSLCLHSGCPGGRLVNGTTCSGIVEIRHGDTWGRLCHSHWNLQAASVLCHQLNCGYAKSIQMEEGFVDGNGPIWRDAFHCKGTESCLWDCVQVTLGNPTCSAKEVASVTCSGKSGVVFYGWCNFRPKQCWWSHWQDLVFEVGKTFLLPFAGPCVHESKQSLYGGSLLNQLWELIFCQHRNLSFIVFLQVISTAVRSVDATQYISQLSWAQVLLNHSDSQGVRAAVLGGLRSPSVVCGAESWMTAGTLGMPMWCAHSSSVELLRKPITSQSLSVARVLLA